MLFKKYSSIENSYRKKFIEKLIYEDKTGGEWIVTEKIHGSNFSLWIDRTVLGEIDIRVGKRSGFIEEAEMSKFFRSDIIFEKYKNNMIELINNNPDIEQITV